MNIQYVRLDDDICEILNRMAEQQSCKVSDLVNSLLKQKLGETPLSPSPCPE